MSKIGNKYYFKPYGLFDKYMCLLWFVLYYIAYVRMYTNYIFI